MATTKFCTVSDVKAHLNAAMDYTGDDQAIDYHIRTATSLIRQYTRRNWEFATRTQVFDSKSVNAAYDLNSGVAYFVLKEKPLVSVSSVVYNSAGDFTSAPLDVDAYTVDLEFNRVIVYPSRMTYKPASVQVTYDAGFEPNAADPLLLDVSENLRQACAIQAAFTFKRVINEEQGSTKSQSKRGAASYGLTVSGLVQEALSLIKSEVRLLVGGHG